MKYNLSTLSADDVGIVKDVIDSPIKRRLLDLGLTKGTHVKKLFGNISESIYAYLIRNTLIAIRNEDAETVILEVNSFDLWKNHSISR